MGLIAIGVVSLGYVLFVRPFAELHVQFPFLDFPVFIGEGLLFLCLGLMLSKGNIKVGRKNFWIFAYLGFVFIKALLGYIKFGPLALRHAALFYYPLFAIFGYSFYRREFFDSKKSLFCILLILLLFASGTFDSYWMFTCILLAFILIWTYPHRIFKHALLATLVLVTPYRFLFCTSRMMIVANFVTGIFLAGGLYFILRIHKAIKLTIVVLGVLFISLGLIRFADKNALTAIVKIDNILEKFRSYDLEVAAQIEKDKQVAEEEAHLRSVSNVPDVEDPEAEKLQVYNPDPPLYFPLREKIRSVGSFVPAQPAANIPVPEKKEAPVSSTAVSVSVPASDALAGTSTKKDKSRTSVKEIKSGKAAKEQSVHPATSLKAAFLKQDQSVAATAPVTVESKPEEVAREKVQIYNPDPPFNFHYLGMKKSADDEQQAGEKQNEKATVMERKPPQLRDLDGAYINAVFRLFIWRDMIVELLTAPTPKSLVGFHFGKPLRPKSLKALNWGTLELFRDGWVEPHNSYLHIIYRAGIIGVIVILALFVLLGKMIKKSIQCRSLPGILLCGILVNWLVAANFLLILELPYTAIPIWTLFGMTYAYVQSLERHFAPEAKTVREEIK